MGTRAQFFIGDPCDVENREWLGCVAFDGYPDGDLRPLAACRTEKKFRQVLKRIIRKRDDFTDPKTEDFPFPWLDNVFVTDVTYAFRNNCVMINWFHSKPIPMGRYIRMSDADKENIPDTLPNNVPAPRNSGAPKGADSIIMISAT